MTDVGRLWRTVRHLKVRQVWGRLAFRLARPSVDVSAAPRRRSVGGGWVCPARRFASMDAPRSWRLLNEPGDLDTLGWDGPQKSKLWRYNQHYFDDLVAGGAEARAHWHVALVNDWLVGNPPARGTGWEPYPLSLRVVNWIKWLIQGQAPDDRWLHSLAVQLRWLAGRLEWHLLGNHLFINAKALVFGGMFFEGPEADRWLQTGLRILQEQLPEQVLADGAQFELSPMYHALALEDVLDLINIEQACRPGALSSLGLRDCAARMRHWLSCMSHPDGDISFFNDAARGIAPSNRELARYARALSVDEPVVPPQDILHLAASGYVRVALPDATAILDVGRVGPDYLPGHAHADTLSFELSVGARRLLVNGGTSCYGVGAQRLAERGTAWHNTAQLGEENSSEVWSGFRVGRRARPVGLLVEAKRVRAGHDGYAHMGGRPIVWREWLVEDNALSVADQVERWDGPATARYHLAPGLRFEPNGPDRWQVWASDQLLAEICVLHGRAEVMPSQHAPEFGVLVDTQALWVNFVDRRAVTRWSWQSHAHPVPH